MKPLSNRVTIFTLLAFFFFVLACSMADYSEQDLLFLSSADSNGGSIPVIQFIAAISSPQAAVDAQATACSRRPASWLSLMFGTSVLRPSLLKQLLAIQRSSGLVQENNDEDLLVKFVNAWWPTASSSGANGTNFYLKCYSPQFIRSNTKGGINGNNNRCSISDQLGATRNSWQAFSFDLLASFAPTRRSGGESWLPADQFQRLRDSLLKDDRSLLRPSCSGKLLNTTASLIARWNDDLQQQSMVGGPFDDVHVFDGDYCPDQFIALEAGRRMSYLCIGQIAPSSSDSSAGSSRVHQQAALPLPSSSPSPMFVLATRLIMPNNNSASSLILRSSSWQQSALPFLTSSSSTSTTTAVISFYTSDVVIIPVVFFAFIVIALPLVYLWRRRVRLWCPSRSGHNRNNSRNSNSGLAMSNTNNVNSTSSSSLAATNNISTIQLPRPTMSSSSNNSNNHVAVNSDNTNQGNNNGTADYSLAMPPPSYEQVLKAASSSSLTTFSS